MADTAEFDSADHTPRKRSDAWWLAVAAIVLVAILISKLLLPG